LAKVGPGWLLLRGRPFSLRVLGLQHVAP
jgi:hypothetical protein